MKIERQSRTSTVSIRETFAYLLRTFRAEQIVPLSFARCNSPISALFIKLHNSTEELLHISQRHTFPCKAVVIEHRTCLLHWLPQNIHCIFICLTDGPPMTTFFANARRGHKSQIGFSKWRGKSALFILFPLLPQPSTPRIIATLLRRAAMNFRSRALQFYEGGARCLFSFEECE